MSKRRILPDRLKAAYERTKVRPAQDCYLEYADDGATLCGCGIAVALMDLRPDLDLRGLDSAQIEALADDEFGSEYVAGFTNAYDAYDFDCNLPDLVSHPDYKQGYLDGEACRIAIFAEQPTLLGKPIEPGPTIADLIDDDE